MKPAPDEKRTAVACLDDDCRLIYYRQFASDEEIIDAVQQLCSVGCVIGVDAPLVVPDGTEGRRVCEGMLAEMQIHVMPTDPKRFEQWYGGCRGVVLMEKLRDKDEGYELVDHLPASADKAVVETAPSGAWKRLYGSVPGFKGVRVEERRNALFRTKEMLKWGMPPRYPPVKMDKVTVLDRSRKDLDKFAGPGLDVIGDALDAVMSAYTVLLWAKDPNMCEIVGDLKNGFILIPRSPRGR